jgi:hypothetical protein
MRRARTRHAKTIVFSRDDERGLQALELISAGAEQRDIGIVTGRGVGRIEAQPYFMKARFRKCPFAYS